MRVVYTRHKNFYIESIASHAGGDDDAGGLSFTGKKTPKTKRKKKRNGKKSESVLLIVETIDERKVVSAFKASRSC